MQKWEYSVAIILQTTATATNKIFNDLGKLGWELVSCILLSQENDITELQYCFKRRKK